MRPSCSARWPAVVRCMGRTSTNHLPIAVACRGRIAHLVLDAPPRNEMTGHVLRELARVCREWLPKQDVDGLVVYGRGRHFSSGANVEELRRCIGEAEAAEHDILRENATSLATIESRPYPVVAAIRGCCLGAGLELALACHYRVATRHATLGLPESTFGLMPGWGGTVRLTSVVRHATAVRMVLGGQSLLAEDAREAGLVDIVVERKELLASAEALIRRLNGRHRGAHP